MPRTPQDGPSPEALAEAARIYRELIEDEFGVRVVPCEPGDPDALVLRSPEQDR